MRPLLVMFPETNKDLPVVELNTFTKPPAFTCKFPFTLNCVGVAPYAKVPLTVKLLMLWLAVVTVTTCPKETVALSAAVGTAVASQVFGFSQLPVLMEINIPGTVDVSDILSTAGPGVAPKPLSF